MKTKTRINQLKPEKPKDFVNGVLVRGILADLEEIAVQNLKRPLQEPLTVMVLDGSGTLITLRLGDGACRVAFTETAQPTQIEKPAPIPEQKGQVSASQ